MTETPMVSVIMNCFDGETYLPEALDSVLAQTFEDWEIVFWDNQSTDRSAEIFNSYADPRFRYWYAPDHTLLYEARNYAIERARGEFIAVLDTDDWWLPHKLEKQLPLFSDPSVGFTCTNCWVTSLLRNKTWLAFTMSRFSNESMLSLSMVDAFSAMRGISISGFRGGASPMAKLILAIPSA